MHLYILICTIWGSHSNGYEDFYLLGYIAVQSTERQLTFQRNVSPSSSESNKPSKMPVWKQVASWWSCFHAGILLGLFNPEHGGDLLLHNNGWFLTDYMALYLSHPDCFNLHAWLNWKQYFFYKHRHILHS
jgi:hypothetical protein